MTFQEAKELIKEWREVSQYCFNKRTNRVLQIDEVNRLLKAQKMVDAEICAELIKENDEELANSSFVTPVCGWLEKAKEKIINQK